MSHPMNLRSRMPGSRFDARAEAFIVRLSTYSVKAEESMARLQKFYTEEETKDDYEAASQEFQHMFPLDSQYQYPIGSPQWNDMWKKIDTVLASDPTTAKELFIKFMVGSAAMQIVVGRELENDPLVVPITNAAEKRAMILLGTHTPREVQPNRAGDLVGRKIRCTDNLGSRLEFIITDYGTSLSSGPWVKYLPRHGKEGMDEVIVAADEMEDILERAEVLP